MSKTIFFFVKIFSERAHAEDFLSGILHSNRLSYFRKLEESEQTNRGDRHEAVVGWYQPDQIKLTLNNHELTDLAAPVTLQMHDHDHINVFCIYAAHSGPFKDITDENILDFKNYLRIPPDCFTLGNHAVIVTQAKTFIDRVMTAAKNKGFGLKAGLVKYYDPEWFSGSFSENDAIFQKRKEFEHQREYRFSFDTDISGDAPLKLEIGNINDIAILCSTDKVNSMLEEFKLSDGNTTLRI